MACKPRYTVAQVITALTNAKGTVYLAAKQLRCDPDTVQRYCKRYPSVAAAKEAARGELIDRAEVRLWEAVDRGDAWAVAFCLRTIGRHRGYVERQEMSGTITHEIGEGLSGLLAAFGGDHANPG